MPGRSGHAGRWTLLVLLLPALPASLAAQVRKVEPILMEALRPDTRDLIQRRGRIDPLAAAEMQPMGGELALSRGSVLEPAMLGVFVRVRNANGVAQIRAAGGQVGAVVGEYVSAQVPLTALDALARSADIENIEAARALRLEHDSSMRAVHVDQLRTLIGDQFSGATGAGAIVGIYDSGIDLTHPDFIDRNGQTRVLGVWDQTSAGKPPEGFGYGYYCTQAEIQQTVDANGAGGCPQRDVHGHGTHVAGTAAGDGSATATGMDAFRYAGVAPEAGLLIVNGGPGVFFENLIIDGLTWMRQEGLRLNRPVVVNLSLGGQFGPHDGSRLYEKMIDALSGPGFIVVISAGNSGVNRNTTPPSGGRLIHARGFATGTAPREFTIDVAPYTPRGDRCNNNFLNLTFWYDGADRLTVTVQRPSGTSASASTGLITTSDAPEGRIRIDNASEGANPENGDNEAFIQINGCGTSGAPEAGAWRIRVTPESPGSGQPYDMWMYSVAGVPAQGGAGFDNLFIVGSPGNATRAITVGAFVTRLCWPVDDQSSNCYVQREEIGDIARFSSAGPTRDGRFKPEITAPGLGVMSAYSRYASIETGRIGPTRMHAVLEGTSMAAPHVTGAIAILLSTNPQLTPEDVKAALAASAVNDEFTTRTYNAPGSLPEYWWGYGKLHVQAALVALSSNAPSILGVATESAAPGQALRGARGTRLPLLRFTLDARGSEAIDVTSIGFDVTGNDPGARLLLVRDANGNESIDPSDTVVGSATTALTPTPKRIVITPDSLRVPAFTPTQVFLAAELSGAAPNGAVFHATLVPADFQSRGVRTGAVNQIASTIQAVESGPATVTVLEEAQLLTLSENPVRDGTVVFNFARSPSTAAVYTLTGRRVLDLCRRAELRCGEGEDMTAASWDLRNEDGNRVAPGVYLLIFQVGGQVFREKLMVLAPSDPPENPEPEA